MPVRVHSLKFEDFHSILKAGLFELIKIVLKFLANVKLNHSNQMLPSWRRRCGAKN